MPDWTRKHFDDIEDRSPADVDMQWRFARKELGFEPLGVSRFSYEPGVRFPFAHRHREQEEAYVVVAGSGRAKLGDEPARDPGDPRLLRRARHRRHSRGHRCQGRRATAR